MRSWPQPMMNCTAVAPHADWFCLLILNEVDEFESDLKLFRKSFRAALLYDICSIQICKPVESLYRILSVIVTMTDVTAGFPPA